MILYLEFVAQKRRGGELANVQLHAFLKQHFPEISPPELHRIPDGVLSPLKQMTHCRSLVKQIKPRLVVSCIPSAPRNILALRMARARGARLLTLISAKPDPYPTRSLPQRLFAGRCESWLFRHTDIFIANSNYTASVARERSGKEPQIVVANSGLETPPEGFPPRSPQTEGPPTILFVGEVSRVKGLGVLVDALGSLGDLDWKLVVAGGATQEPDYAARVEQSNARYGFEDRVTKLGFVDRERLLELYSTADLLVIPSLAEGYCKVMAEAICAGLPTVATRVGAIEELTDHGRLAALVAPGDVSQMAEAIAGLLEDVSRRDELGRAARAQAQSIPTWADFHRTLETELLPRLKKLL